MARHFFIRSESIKSKIRDTARRCALVGVLSSVALLSAPFVNSPDHEERLPPSAAIPRVAQSRIGVTLRRGDTLGSLLKRFGIEPPSAHAVIEKVRPFVDPRKIRPGDSVQVVVNAEDRTVESLEFVADDNLVRIKATDGGWAVERLEIPFVRDSRIIHGAIRGSLYESGIEAGLSPQQILNLAKIFEYDIDFLSDFQPNDRFSVIVEEVRYADGRRLPGRILAAKLEADDDIFDAYYFVDRNGSGDYYNSNGEARRRSFLRAPLSYARISSPFNRSRMHPIFRTLRPHLAIDYAAPAGTPVVAIGVGKIEFAGWRAGYGNVVDIRHSGNYMSRYAHFSRFAPKLRKGQSVDAGDVIGYVGQTGHATGPHLHFEFLRGGAKINFLDLRIPKIQHLTGEDLQRFGRLRDQRETMLRGENERVAADPQSAM